MLSAGIISKMIGYTVYLESDETITDILVPLNSLRQHYLEINYIFNRRRIIAEVFLIWFASCVGHIEGKRMSTF